MSTTPKEPCPSGYYCPNATAILPCPAGRFCKWWTKIPRVRTYSLHTCHMMSPSLCPSKFLIAKRAADSPICAMHFLIARQFSEEAKTPPLQGCPWLAKCPAGSASADISLGGFFALFLILLLLWLAYVAFSAYIKCAPTCAPY